MPQERSSQPLQPPKETRMFRSVSMEAIAQMLQTLPIPITITQQLDEQREKFFYRYQVGTPTQDNPVGLRMGATPNFLDAVRVSLEAITGRQERAGDAGQFADTKPINQAPADVWIVPEVERGECCVSQAASLGLPYRHRITGETIAEWTERTQHEQADAASRGWNIGGEQHEQEIIHLLRHLPLSITITKQDDTYIWQCLDQNGTSTDFVGVVGYSLHYLLGQLMQEHESRRGTYRTFGDVLYQSEDGYTERVITDTSRGRVVMCERRGSIKLFRVEWAEPDGYERNKATYTLQDAMDAFQETTP